MIESEVWKLNKAQQEAIIKGYGKKVPQYEKDRVALILELQSGITVLKEGVKNKKTEIASSEVKGKFELTGERDGKTGFIFKNHGIYNGAGKIVLAEGAKVKVKS